MIEGTVTRIMKLIRDKADESVIEKAINNALNMEYVAGLRVGAEDQRSRTFNATHGHEMGQ